MRLQCRPASGVASKTNAFRPTISFRRSRRPAVHLTRSRPRITSLNSGSRRKVGRKYEPRWDTWDTQWFSDGRILTLETKLRLRSGPRAATGCSTNGMNRTERRSSYSGRRSRVSQSLGERGYEAGWKDKAVLRRFDLSTFESKDIDIGFPASLSTCGSGHVLVRDVTTGSHEERGDPRHDMVLSPDWHKSETLNLGAYGIFSDYSRVDGAEDLYFLRGPRRSIAERNGPTLVGLETAGPHRFTAHSPHLDASARPRFARGDAPVPPRVEPQAGEAAEWWGVPVRARRNW